MDLFLIDWFAFQFCGNKKSKDEEKTLLQELIEMPSPNYGGLRHFL